MCSPQDGLSGAKPIDRALDGAGIGNAQRGSDRHCEESSDEAIRHSSFRDGPQDRTRNLEIPGSMLRIATE